MSFNWQCPHCQQHTTITDGRSVADHTLKKGNVEGQVTLRSMFIVCPNEECRKFTLTAHLNESTTQAGYDVRGALIKFWSLVPESSAKVFPDYVPVAIRSDYEEACLIKALSPKASATLSRRCLQGMLRDFWKVKPDTLFNEIDAIRSEIDGDTWAAIDGLRKIGNIGAHMEKDVNLIIDVEADEAGLLIGLVETLIADWYVTRHERRERMKAIQTVADQKVALKLQGPQTAASDVSKA